MSTVRSLTVSAGLLALGVAIGSQLPAYKMTFAQARQTAFIDRFGQNCKVNFEGKIRIESELADSDKSELADLAQHKPPAQRDLYQGTTSGITSKATGFFRLQKIEGKWWFIDPLGNQFYSTAIDCIGTSANAKVDTKTKPLFQWLPSEDKNFRTAGTSLYTANLMRKYGKERFDAIAQSRALERNLSWGFTSLGNWTDAPLIVRHKLPYVHTGPKTWQCKVTYIEGDICDVYDPKFAAEAKRAASELRANKDDKWLIGYFVDNELPWWNLGYTVLGLPNSAPAHQAWLEMLKKKYSTVSALNKAWGTKATSFSKLRWPGERATESANADLAAYRRDFAERFYAAWYQAVKAADPNHLVLGSRIPFPMDEVVEACAKHTDALSFNHYDYKVWKELDRYARLGKPILVGEYGFNSLDSGLLAASVKVKSQSDRGIGFSYLTEQFAAKPYMIGSHYFQYLDEPLTGRSSDGENSYNGFVNVADIPYRQLVAAARRTNSRIYDIHAGRSKPTELQPQR